MADEPKPDTAQPAPSAGDANAGAPAGENAANISPAPTEVADGAPGGGATPPGAPDPNARVQAEPLADGTTPTVLSAGTSHKSVRKGPASITSVYRKADIMTTIFTFAGALVAAAIIFGIYAYFTRTKTPTKETPKVTALDKSDLDKLGAFFTGNSAGTDSQVLTISASTLFSNRVAINTDLKVLGGIQVAGTTALGDLTVDKTTTLGVTNIRGQLVVAGPVNFQSPAQFGAGGTFNGNLSVTGNGSFGGTISANTLNVQNLTVSGTLNLAGHLSIAGQTPTVSPGSESGSGASASVEGNDSSGGVTINTGTIGSTIGPGGGLLVVVNFKSAYPRAPHVVISSVGQNGAALLPYVLVNANGFTIGVVNTPASNKAYSFNYWVAQ